jgi:hypothetical protein
VDNTSEMDFDLEPGNVDMEMVDDLSVRGQEEEEEEEEETEIVGEQEVASTGPSLKIDLLLVFLRIFFVCLIFHFGFTIL